MCFLFFVLGSIFGSFMNVLIYRLPRGVSIIAPASSCPNCKAPIRWYNNIPIISYIFLKGVCRDCGKKIPFRYLVVEFTVALIFLLICYRFGINMQGISYLVFSFFMLTSGFTDLYTAFEKDEFECGVIPAVILYMGIVLGVVTSYFNGVGVLNSLLGMVLGFLSLFLPAFLYKLFKKREGMGDGDMYLMAMTGSFLGFKSVLPVILISSFLGAIVGIIIIRYLKDNSFPIPFGPFIAFGSLFYMFYGEKIIDLYIGMVR
ncbi:MAG: prepilin peptidase [Calditerrivibrio sp.]|nr:prepilin peptidase [Calditerrivibrio sp.]